MAAKQHKPYFITSTQHGAQICCECGWKQKLPDMRLSPLHTVPSDIFFRAGVDAGREYQHHLPRRMR